MGKMKKMNDREKTCPNDYLRKCLTGDWVGVVDGKMARERTEVHGLKGKEMGRGRLCWTKKISINEWCLVSSL